MTTDSSETRPRRETLAGRLVTETGITLAQADELVLFLGSNWPSLVREAKLLPKLRAH